MIGRPRGRSVYNYLKWMYRKTKHLQNKIIFHINTLYLFPHPNIVLGDIATCTDDNFVMLLTRRVREVDSRKTVEEESCTV